MQTSSSPSPAATASPVHIEVTPGTCGGKPRIAGTRIRVQDIVIWHERLGLSADEICSQYPQVNLAAVYAALAYYHDHRDEIDRQMEQGQALVEELKRQYPSKLQMKLKVPPA
jgi:uncharacterized protein (DUF433 family)